MDHEEVGSVSREGADSNFLASVFESLQNKINLERSFFYSVDCAHGFHPNYPDVHDPFYRPLLNAGPVLKINSNQRYATNVFSHSLVKKYAMDLQIPIQEFLVRNDMGCGSTIGPMVAKNLGVFSIDLGLPIFAMHSCKETGGTKDPIYLYKLLKHAHHTQDLDFSSSV